VIDADGHPRIVFGQIVDSVGNGFAVGLPRKVVGGYLDWLTTGMPFFTGLGVPSYQFLFLGVHTDHRVTAGEELRGEGVEVPELGVPVGVLAPFQSLAGGLQAVSAGMKTVRDDRMADGVAPRSQLPGELTRRFGRPSQR
jgi:hypothetical protein